jgi:glycerophosphoryl diester phosphodiesterase
MARFNTTRIIAVSIEIIKKDHLFVVNQHKQGKKVMVWTVNNQDDLNLCQELGIYAVITDKPARMRSFVRLT